MSSAGINPLAIVAPDLYAKQLAIARRQALAQSLLQSGEGDPGKGAYGGLRTGANALLGAFLAKRSDQDLANFYSGADQSQPPQPSPQVSNTPMPSQPSPTGEMDPEGNQMYSPQVSNMPGAGGPQVSNPPPQQQGMRTPSSVLGGTIPDLPGLSHQQSMLAYAQSPGDYWKAVSSANAPTDTQKNARFAFPGDTQGQQSIVGAGLAKSGAIQATRGVTWIPDGRGGMTPIYAPPQAPEGYQNQMGPNGQLMVTPTIGGPQAVQGSNYAAQLGQKGVTPATGYDPNTHMPVATNAATMATGGVSDPNQQFQQPLGIRSNNPGNLQPGGREATYGTPAEGILRAANNLDAYAARGINTVAGVVGRWAPPGANNTPAYTSYVAQKLGVDPNQPINLKDPAVKGKVLDAIFSYENGPANMQAAGGGQRAPLLPELPAGQATYMQGQAASAQARQEATRQAAADVPTRLNVLQNILNLSKITQTGSPEWLQASREAAAGLSQAMGHNVDPNNQAALMGEIQKYMGQYTNRASSGRSDMELGAVQHANPNDQMFPATLQRVVPWIMANERGTAAKASAQDQFLQQHGNTATTQNAFENQWRNVYDPRVFQYSQMTPQEKQTFAQQELKTPQAAKAFIQKQQQLKALGAIQ